MSSLDLATATATVTQALFPVFLSYATYHAINPTFMIHGLTLLARFLDLRRSHHGCLSFLMPETHLIDLGSCVNVVYMKLWGTDLGPNWQYFDCEHWVEYKSVRRSNCKSPSKRKLIASVLEGTWAAYAAHLLLDTGWFSIIKMHWNVPSLHGPSMHLGLQS